MNFYLIVILTACRTRAFQTSNRSEGNGSAKWVRQKGNVKWVRGKWVRQIDPSNGSVKWVREIDPSNGSAEWVRQMGPPINLTEIELL